MKKAKRITQRYVERMSRAGASLVATIHPSGEHVIRAYLPAGMSSFPEFVLRTESVEAARAHWRKVDAELSRMKFEKDGVPTVENEARVS